MPPRDFFARTAPEVAPELLGCLLTARSREGSVTIRITEVEAYAGARDPASHAYRGRTARNAVMFGPPGHAYVYFIYGMHYAVNTVCMPEGTGEGVLIRAGEVVDGLVLARARRVASRVDADLARGPGRLATALGLTRELDGSDLCAPRGPLTLELGKPVDGALIRSGPRVGVSRAADVPWRFHVHGDPTVSPYRRAKPAKTAS
ncbi:DNA-3-methyladenine glycosylase [Actinospica sp.]|uniref:DNA-3-methyladenine glycosylase n=1 Tax=Actinospica sp. TaxID=1872142 RepID=UPI002C4674AD|nr:DNA-3-methyladenine glycosylase [Actinospica sp.]HWG25330.1 DNA-3-methyladenine glycosylase [Actinospica sp.]